MTERGNHVAVEIPCFSLGQHGVCSEEKTSGWLGKTQSRDVSRPDEEE